MEAVIVPFICAVIVVALIAINYVAVTRQERNQPPKEPAEIDWDAINSEAVQAALERGNKIQAIKEYRQLTGYGLKESKDAVDYAERHPDERFERSAKKKKAAADNSDAGIRDLILDGRIDEAVEVYQRFAGVDAYTARDAVDEIARELHGNLPPDDTPFRSSKN
ncbi:MAG: ribosomal protein L7/L12 [Chloroflexi bacterium]|nr:ribosomal protein L7/L12 [Chloroflexota bacterium]MCC6895431.1 ribosomal protein L7/L12 [Anaerolineae bacterium]